MSVRVSVCVCVCMCVCVCVCVCELFFVKDFSETNVPMILKFGTNIGYDKVYCVLKNQPHMAYQSLYLSIFLSFQYFFPSYQLGIYKTCFMFI